MVRCMVAVRIDLVELAAVFAHSDKFAFADGAGQLTLDLVPGLVGFGGNGWVAALHEFIELGA